MAFSNIQQLKDHIEKMFQEIEQEIRIQSLLASKDGQELYFRTYNKLNNLQVTMLKLKEEINKGKKEIEILRKNTNSLVELQAKLNEMIIFLQGQNTKKEIVSVDSQIQQENQVQAVNIPKRVVPKGQKGVPKLNIVNDKDFAKIPKHIKAHLTVDQFNAGIDDVNQILRKKYEFLNKPKKQLSLAEGRKRAIYLEQGKELKGTPYSTFFMDDDIQSFSTTLKSKRKTKDTVFLTLRHLGKMKEIHEGFKTRYIILSI